MNFSDIYNKIKNIDEGGITWQPNPGTPAQEPIQDRGSYSPRPAPAEPAPVARPSITPMPAPAAMPAEGKDLGNGFTLTKTTVAGAEYPAVLDTQSNTYWIQNKNAGGTAIIRSPVQYISVVNGQMKGGQPGGETTAALQAAGLKESINENSNENFMSLYKQIRAIDEGTNPQHSHQYDTTMKHADNPTVQQRMAAHDIKPGVSGYRDRIDMLKDLERTGKLKDEGMEECGDMMALPMSMGHEHSGQEDSVTMSVSMNGSGDGGIRDLMNILKGIENVGEPHTDHDEMDVVFGGEMEPEMEQFANSMAGASGKRTFPQNTVTDIGSNDGRGDHEVRKASGGGNPYTQVSEELVGQLSNLYQEIKTRQQYEEGYNPNSVAAQHARDLEKSRVDDLKKKAEAGDEKAKAALKRHEDKKAGMRADFDARMER